MQEFEQKGKKQKYSFFDGSSFATSDRVLSCVWFNCQPQCTNTSHKNWEISILIIQKK